MGDDTSKTQTPDASAKEVSQEALAATMLETDGLSAASQADDSRTADTGAQVVDGRYELIALLGQGGMGNVYKARDVVLGEVVALKTLKPELIDHATAVERFRAEVKLARRVTHRNVARTFDLGDADGVPYLTMEYVEGDDLARVLEREGRLTLGRVVELVAPVLDGLAAAHEVGIIHRDLKPQNVIVARDGRVVLTDFGIARATQPDRHLTGEGIPLGTPAYMAPEQVEGKVDLDPRADIYALGVMCFEMLAARLPFSGNTPMATALSRLVEEPPRLAEHRSDLADEIAAVVDRCLARDRDERWESVDALREAFHRAVAQVSGERADAPPAPQTRPGAPPTSAAGAPRWRSSSAFDSFEMEQTALKRVAVLPFRNSGSDEDAYIADGLTEDLIDELSMSRSLKVRPRGAVMPYKQSDTAPRAVGESLSVDVVVDGSIRRAGDRVRVRVALVSVDDGFQIWAKRFKGGSGDLFDISEEAARAIVDALAADQLATPQPGGADSGAIDVYLRARHEMHEAWFSTDMSAAIELFEEAVAQAPNDPRVLSGAAMAYARAAFYDSPNQHEYLRRAENYAQRALSTAPLRPEPRLALALVQVSRLEYGAAVAHLREIIARAPSNADAHDLLGRIYRETGPLDRSIRHLETALELDPNLYKARWDLAYAYGLAGRFGEVDRLLNLPVHSDSEREAREAARCRTDTWRDEPQWLDEGAQRPVQPTSSMLRHMCEHRRHLTRTGDFNEEHLGFYRMGLAASVDGSRLNLVIRQLGIEGMALGGSNQLALDELEKAADVGLLDLVWVDRCPLFDTFRDSPRFKSARDKVAARVDAVMAAVRAPE